MAEWFVDWFNTEEYLNVYQHRNKQDAEKLVNLILSKIKLSAGSKALDLACGAGRHSLLFAQNGFKVTAVDLSEKLIKVAKKSAEELNLKIDFIESDLRYFFVKGKFDLVVNLFTSFGYFDSDFENLQIFKVAINHLKEKGFFVFDFLNADYLKNNLVKKSVDIIAGGFITQERKIENKRIIKNITIAKYETEQKFMESVRLYSSDELITAIQSVGFKVNEILGDFDGNSFNLLTSPRVIIFAQK